MVTLGVATQARANLDACGGMYLDAAAAASCEVVPTEKCTQKCEPVAGEKVCAARLTTMCASSCTLTAEVSCLATCEESCVPDCTQTPDCMGLCMSDCSADCSAKCADHDDVSECESSCTQCCSVDCDAQCKTAPPAPACEPVCGLACTGSCVGKANIDCQVDCQSTFYTACKTEVVEECKTECKNTGAAIFCDGQFLATAGDLEACANELASELDVHLDVDIEASASCDDDGCKGRVEADAAGGFFCAATPGQDTRGAGVAGGLMALLGLGLLRLRRTRRSA